MAENHIRKSIMRSRTVDIMKGLAILLMLAGHGVAGGTTVHSYIFAFHMPLFFILSGRYYHGRTPISKDAKHLLLPAFICYTTVFILWEIREPFNYHHLTRVIKGAFWCTATRHATPNAEDIFLFGPIWFLPALFWCKRIFGWLEKYVKQTLLLGVVCACLFAGMILFHDNVMYIPLGITQGVTAVFFYYIGFLSGKVTINWKRAVPFMALFAVLPFYHTLNMDGVRYGLWAPLLVASAVGGCLVCCYLSKLIELSRPISFCFEWLGQNTMLILVVHQIDISTGAFLSCDNLMVRLIVSAIAVSLILRLPVDKYVRKFI